MKKRQWPWVAGFIIFWGALFLPQAYCQITNEGNVETRVVVTLKDGRTTSTSLLPNEDMPLPDDAVQVKVDNPDLRRGNEDVFIRITMDDGREGRIYGNGGTYVVPGPGVATPFEDLRGV